MVWSCSEVVWALFSALKVPVLGVFLARKVDIWPLKSKFYGKIWPSERVILTILEAKKVVFGLFESCFGDAHKLILSHFPLLWGPAVALNEKKPKVFDLRRKIPA